MGVDVKEAGRRGGKERAKRMTPEQRARSARKAARARWKKYASSRKRPIEAEYRLIDDD
jgi:hypothetical protein